jgi:chromate transport protein ChrA
MSAFIVPIVVGVVLFALRRRGRGQLVATDYATVLVFVAAMIALLKFAGPALRTAVSITCGLILFVRTYVWHRTEIRAGRREPVWFGKH